MAWIASAVGIRRTEWLGDGGRSWLQPSELSKDVLWPVRGLHQIWLLQKCPGSDWHGPAWLRWLLLFLGKVFLRPDKLRSSGPWVMTTADHQSGKRARGVHRRFGFIALACSLVQHRGVFLSACVSAALPKLAWPPWGGQGSGAVLAAREMAQMGSALANWA